MPTLTDIKGRWFEQGERFVSLILSHVPGVAKGSRDTSALQGYPGSHAPFDLSPSHLLIWVSPFLLWQSTLTHSSRASHVPSHIPHCFSEVYHTSWIYVLVKSVHIRIQTTRKAGKCNVYRNNAMSCVRQVRVFS